MQSTMRPIQAAVGAEIQTHPHRGSTAMTSLPDVPGFYNWYRLAIPYNGLHLHEPTWMDTMTYPLQT